MRLDCNAPLEPRAGILHGAGQDFETFRDYCALMAPHGLRPDLFMAYAGLRGLTRERLEKLRAYWDLYPDDPPLLQLGLSMTTDGQPEQCYAEAVARGEHDAQVALLGAFLAAEGRPALVRIGYECTGPWNGYQPDSYTAAFRRVARLLRAHAFPLATVWCVEGGWTTQAGRYYPGDDVVDWWSVDLFAPDHFDATEPFMAEAMARRKPVLVGECTPRRVGVLDGPLSWERWFAPFFAWLDRHRHVKGFCYINWDWSRHPQWHDWGDARLQRNPFVLERWIGALRARL